MKARTWGVVAGAVVWGLVWAGAKHATGGEREHATTQAGDVAQAVPVDGEPSHADMTPMTAVPAQPAGASPAADVQGAPSGATGPSAAAGIGPSRATPKVAWLEYAGKGYAISATEVTLAQFEQCLNAGKCKQESIDTSAGTHGACNYGVAQRAEHPMNCVDYHGAEAFCAYAGGRLCTFEEWIDACSGPKGHPYPYGTEFEQLACHAASRAQPAEGRPVTTLPAGSLGTCEGGLRGLYDMAGNVMEWVASCKENYCKFLGGAYLGNDPLDLFNSCKGPCGGNQKEFRSATIGIRCCKDVAAP